MVWKLRTYDADTGELLEELPRGIESEEEARHFQRFTQRFVRNVARAAHCEWEERQYGDDPRDIALRITGGRWGVVMVEEEIRGEGCEAAGSPAGATPDGSAGAGEQGLAAAVDTVRASGAAHERGKAAGAD